MYADFVTRMNADRKAKDQRKSALESAGISGLFFEAFFLKFTEMNGVVFRDISFLYKSFCDVAAWLCPAIMSPQRDDATEAIYQERCQNQVREALSYIKKVTLQSTSGLFDK